jgi:hypothetical protein
MTLPLSTRIEAMMNVIGGRLADEVDVDVTGGLAAGLRLPVKVGAKRRWSTSVTPSMVSVSPSRRARSLHTCLEPSGNSASSAVAGRNDELVGVLRFGHSNR